VVIFGRILGQAIFIIGFLAALGIAGWIEGM